MAVTHTTVPAQGVTRATVLVLTPVMTLPRTIRAAATLQPGAVARTIAPARGLPRAAVPRLATVMMLPRPRRHQRLDDKPSRL